MIRVHNTQYSLFLRQADVMRRSGKLCDAIISVESQVFKAHRLVLACASKTLENQLTLQASDSDWPNNIDHPHRCSLKLLSPHTFQQILDFAYTECLEVPVDDLPQLLKAAQLLQMHPLEEQCHSQLKALENLMRETRERKERDPRETKETEMTEIESKITKEKDETPLIDEKPPSSPFTVDPAFSDTTEDTPGSSLQERTKALTPTPVPATLPPARCSVIATTSQPPPSHPSSSRFMWHQVNALRRMALNYNDFLAVQSSSSLHPSHHVVTYPFPLSASNVYPLLSSSIPPHVHSSILGYPGIQHPYNRPLLSGSREPGGILKQGLLGKRDPVDKPSEGQRYSQEHPEQTLDCQNCNKAMLNSSWLPTSTANPSGSGETSLGYKYCGCGFRVERPARPHRRGQGGEKPYQCKCCSKRFSLKHQLDTHHRVHTGEKPFECRLCGQRSRDYSAMIKHLRTHGGATPYQCTACLEFCSSLAAMQKHLKNHPLQDFPPDWTINRTYLYTCHS
ncbi:zinc finger and BTB domain-containing protein 16-A [Esox lucius]|uniref:Uncharacterized protein n=1 Tax=Esox lucius TaxID=8010 RepID=A0AAY5JXN9_ESOLU|nr:zinc finger and BTB domain-containing protein 16-A [Esox lucius]XP_019896657.1 zinc finger and BTB domain-containing protein 16-A [Esox lucius]